MINDLCTYSTTYSRNNIFSTIQQYRNSVKVLSHLWVPEEVRVLDLALEVLHAYTHITIHTALGPTGETPRHYTVQSVYSNPSPFQRHPLPLLSVTVNERNNGPTVELWEACPVVSVYPVRPLLCVYLLINQPIFDYMHTVVFVLTVELW